MKYLKIVLKVVTALYCAFAVILSIGWWISDEPLFFAVEKADYYDNVFNNHIEGMDSSSRSFKSSSIYNRFNYISYGYEGYGGFCGNYSVMKHDILMRHSACYDLIFEADKDNAIELYVFNYAGKSVFIPSMPDDYFIPVPDGTTKIIRAGFVDEEQIKGFNLNERRDNKNGTPATCDLMLRDGVIDDIYVSPMAANLYSNYGGKGDMNVSGRLFYVELEDAKKNTHKGIFCVAGSAQFDYRTRYN